VVKEGGALHGSENHLPMKKKPFETSHSCGYLEHWISRKRRNRKQTPEIDAVSKVCHATGKGVTGDGKSDHHGDQKSRIRARWTTDFDAIEKVVESGLGRICHVPPVRMGKKDGSEPAPL